MDQNEPVSNSNMNSSTQQQVPGPVPPKAPQGGDQKISSKTIWVSILVLVILLVGAAAFFLSGRGLIGLSTPGQTQPLETNNSASNIYKNEKYDFQITYPSGWIVSSTTPPTVAVLIGTSEDAFVTPVPKEQAFMYVNIENGDLTEATSSYAQNKTSVDAYNKTATDTVSFEETPPIEMTIGDFDAERFESSSTELAPGSGFNVGHAVDYLLYDKSLPYIVFHLALSVAEPLTPLTSSYISQFDEAVKSFSIISEAWNTYEDPDKLFSIEYPPFWSVSNPQTDPSGINESIGFKVPTNKSPSESVVVLVSDLTNAPQNLKSLASYSGGNYQNLKASADISGLSPLMDSEISGLPAEEVTYTQKATNGNPVGIVSLFTVYNDHVFDITYAYDASQGKQYADYVKKMTDSFKINMQ